MNTLKDHIKAIRGPIAAQIFFSAIYAFAFALIPAYNKYLVDKVLVNHGENFLQLVLLYVFTIAVNLAATWLSVRFNWIGSVKFENSLKRSCFDKLLRMPATQFQERKSSEYVSLITNNISTLEMDYLTPKIAMIKDFLSILIYAVVVAVTTSPLICLILVTVSIAVSFSPHIHMKGLNRVGKAYTDEQAVYTKKIYNLLQGFTMLDEKTEKSYAEVNRNFTDTLSQKRLTRGFKKNISNIASGGAIFLGNAVLFLAAGVLFLAGKITLGIVVAALTNAQTFLEPLQDLLYCANTLNTTKSIASEIDDFLKEDIIKESKRKPQSNIQSNHVVVNFHKKQLNYHFTFQLGKKYVLYGPSGSGKSTLLRVLTGTIPYEGNLLVDSHACKIDSNAYFFLNQHQHIFSDDFWSNVTLYGAYPIEKNELRAIFGNDALFDKVQHTQDCSKLSGGEQQAVKICRMLAQRKPILFLDEPFSDLDKANSEILIRNLNNLARTVILITHSPDITGLEQWNHIPIQDVCNEVI